MSKARPKEKRRGGTRDDSWLTIDLNRRQLAALLEQIRHRCAQYQLREQSPWARH